MAATRGRLCFWILGILMSLARAENTSSNSGPTRDVDLVLSLDSASQSQHFDCSENPSLSLETSDALAQTNFPIYVYNKHCFSSDIVL